MQRFKEARDSFPSRSGAGVSRRKKEKGTALGELMGWAAAVFNDFQEEDTDSLELGE